MAYKLMLIENLLSKEMSSLEKTYPAFRSLAFPVQSLGKGAPSSVQKTLNSRV